MVLCPAKGWITSHSPVSSSPSFLSSCVPPNPNLPLNFQGCILSVVRPPQPIRIFLGSGKSLGYERGRGPRGSLGGRASAVARLRRRGLGQGPRGPDWLNGHEARCSRPLVVRAQPIRVQAGLGRQVVGVGGAGAGVCVGRKGLGPPGTPKGFRRSPCVWESGALRLGSREAAPPSTAPLPAAPGALPPTASRVWNERARPRLPSAAEGRARLPAPQPAAPSPRPPAARCSPGAPARPHPRRPSVERRAAGARGERGASRWSGRRGPGPGWGRGTRSGRRSLSPRAPSRAAGAAPPPGRCPHPRGKVWGAGEGTRACAPVPLSWSL